MVDECIFDRQFLDGDVDMVLFQEWAENIGSIKLTQINREEWNSSYKNNFLKREDLSKKGRDFEYELFIPTDMSFAEFLKISKEVNNRFFGAGVTGEGTWMDIKDVGTVAIMGNLKANDFMINTDMRDFLFELIGRADFIDPQIHNLINSSPTDLDDSKQVLKRRRALYRQMKKSGVNMNDMDSIEKFVLKFVEENFLIMLFHRGLDNIVENAKNYTFAEMMMFLYDDNKDIGVKEEAAEILNMMDYDDIETKLATLLNIDWYKSEISKARGSANYQLLAKLELDMLTKIQREVFKYPWFEGTSYRTNSSSVGIFDKEIVCVGKTLLCISFLRKLGIEYTILNIPQHVALRVSSKISKDERVVYFVDPTQLPIPIDITDKKARTVGVYYEIEVLPGKFVHLNNTDPFKGIISTILTNFGSSFQDEGKLDIANKFYDYSIALNPVCYLGYLNRGLSKLSSGKYLDAIHDLTKANILYPESAFGIYQQAICYFRMGRDDDALKVLDDIILRSPQYLKAYHLKAIILLNQWFVSNDSKSTSRFKQIHKLIETVSYYSDKVIEKSNSTLIPASYVLKGLLYLGMGNHTEAITYFKEALIMGFDHPEINLYIGYCFLRTKKTYLAKEEFKEVLSKDPTFEAKIQSIILKYGGNL